MFAKRWWNSSDSAVVCLFNYTRTLTSNRPADATINHPRHIALPEMGLTQPRAQGSGQLSVFADAHGATRLRNLRQSGSLKLVLPQTYAPHAEAIVVNTAGGITGGDKFTLGIDVEQAARLSVTTQAAERAYRAQSSEVGSVTTHINVGEGARLNWLPQELILFDRCALRRKLTIDLAPTARLLMVEPVVFGRAAMPEVLRDVMFRDRIRINRAGVPLYIDGMDLDGDAAAHLGRAATGDGAGAMASLVMVAPDAQSHLDDVRAMLPPTAGGQYAH